MSRSYRRWLKHKEKNFSQSIIPDHLAADLTPPPNTADFPSFFAHFTGALLRYDKPEVQAEAAYLLACFCSSSDDSGNTILTIEKGGVQNAIHLLQSTGANVREQALWLLANLTGDSSAKRDVFLGYGLLEQLFSLLTDEPANVNILRPATLVLFNLISYKPQPPLEQMRPAIQALLRLVQSIDDKATLTYACWAIEHLCDDSADKFQALIEADVSSKLAKLFLFHSSTVQLSALRTVRRIVKKSSGQAQPIFDRHLLALFMLLTEKHKTKVKTEVCRIISYIPGGSVEHVQAFIDAGITVALIGLFLNKGLEIKVKTVRAIGNATSGANSDQIKFLMKRKYIDVLCGLLDGGDLNIILLCIGLLENILNAARTPKERNFFAQKMRDVGKKLRDLSNLRFEEGISGALINIAGVWDGIL